MAKFQTNILFWNIQKKQPAQQIVAMVGRYDVDAVLLAESGYADAGSNSMGSPGALEAALNGPALGGAPKFAELPDSHTSRVQIFSRLPKSAWTRKCHRSRYDIWQLRRREGREIKDFFLAAAHFPDIRNEQGDGQRKCAIDLRLDIAKLEQKVLRQAPSKNFMGLPLLVMGDLNASPFDGGIAGVYGLNATQRRAVARFGTREMDSIHYPFLYNPMWQFFGAREGKAPGTYYKRLSKPVCYDWYILDQVLLRPALLPLVEDSDVRILEHTGVTSLVKNDQRPDAFVSDHLPILISIKM